MVMKPSQHEQKFWFIRSNQQSGGAELRNELAMQQKPFRLPARFHSQLWKMAVNQRHAAAATTPGFLQKQINISLDRSKNQFCSS